jgi:uronate dehydrogenase
LVLQGMSAVTPSSTVLITGAAGNIGGVLRRGLAGLAGVIRLADLTELDPRPGEQAVKADFRDFGDARRAVTGCDAVVHLAAIPVEDEFEHILESNLRGTYNLFEAARIEGCNRVVLASSNHVTGFHGVADHIGTDAARRPDSFYGLSKSYGEDLGRLYFDRHRIEVACLRIGSMLERPTEERHLSTWLSHRDCVQLVRCCLEVEALDYLVVYGVSANQRSWWRPDGWERIGYQPEDDAETFAGSLEQGPVYHFQGGPFAT